MRRRPKADWLQRGQPRIMHQLRHKRVPSSFQLPRHQLLDMWHVPVQSTVCLQSHHRTNLPGKLGWVSCIVSPHIAYSNRPAASAYTKTNQTTVCPAKSRTPAQLAPSLATRVMPRARAQCAMPRPISQAVTSRQRACLGTRAVAATSWSGLVPLAAVHAKAVEVAPSSSTPPIRRTSVWLARPWDASANRGRSKLAAALPLKAAARPVIPTRFKIKGAGPQPARPARHAQLASTSLAVRVLRVQARAPLARLASTFNQPQTISAAPATTVPAAARASSAQAAVGPTPDNA